VTLRSIVSPRTATALSHERPSEQALSRLLSVTNYYEEKVGPKSRTANGAMRIVAKEIERNGIHGVRDSYVEDPQCVGIV
jgi:hypothetical protein